MKGAVINRGVPFGILKGRMRIPIGDLLITEELIVLTAWNFVW